ncbi:MAG: hypothetical protein ACOX6D_01850 [Thermoguttaceae bacterium]|jgi:flagellar export protein FliJ
MKIASLIKLRENSRDQRRLALLDAESREQALRTKIVELDALLEQNQAEWRQAETRRPIPLEELRLCEARQQELSRLKKETAFELLRAAGAVSEARNKLRESVREVKVLENLRDRKESEAAVAEKKSEQKKMYERDLL